MRGNERILIYSTQFMPTGGIESHLQEFCTHMAESGVAIDIVIPHSQMLPETQELFRNNCSGIYFGCYKSPYARFIFLFLVSIRLLFNNYVSLYTNGQGESVGLFARLCRFRNWVHHHHTSGDAADQATWGKQYIKVLKIASTVIACSKTNAASMAAFLKREVQVIACFSRKIFIRKKKAINPDAIALGYYGRLIPEKGIDILCRLSEEPELDFVKFHIWGQGEVYPVSFFKNYPDVIYHGAFSGRKELTEAVALLDAFLLLSVHPEGLPISLLEVMSAGLPWIATDKGGIPDIACDPVSTRVIPACSNYIEMKAAVLKLAKDIRNGSTTREEQIRLYDSRFSATVLTQQWKTVLHV